MEFDIDPVQSEPERAVPLALLITEVETNALKHAWTPGAAGLLKIALKQGSDAMIVMSTTEDGNNNEYTTTESPGSRLIPAFATTQGSDVADGDKDAEGQGEDRGVGGGG